MSHQLRLMVMAGGTGGHVFPGITVARYMIDHGWKIRWLGTPNHLEAKLVPKNGIEIDFICISGLRGKSIKTSLLTSVQILSAWNRARSVMKQFNPNVVLGMGGYVSGPGGLAAKSLRIPIVLHEQNSVAGLTNKWLSKISKKVLQAFPGAFPNAKVVGNPIRFDLLNLPSPEIRLRCRKGPLRVLVIGGSQGARFLNQAMPKVAKQLNAASITLWHQSGKGLKDDVKKAYSNSKNLPYKITEFIDDMAEAYSWADIVVCRSGALTVSEISAIGLPAIFVPFQHKDRQQYWNAFPLEKIGAAKIFEQSKCTVDLITSTLSNLNREMLLTMAKRAYTLASLNATEKIAKELCLITENTLHFKH